MIIFHDGNGTGNKMGSLVTFLTWVFTGSNFLDNICPFTIKPLTYLLLMEEALNMRKSITHIPGDLFLFKIVGDNLNVHIYWVIL